MRVVDCLPVPWRGLPLRLLLAESFAIRIVNGTDNCIDAVGATSLANALRDNVARTVLDLRGALLLMPHGIQICVGTSAATALFVNLNAGHAVVYVSAARARAGNHLGGAGAVALADALKGNRSLTDLWLDGERACACRCCSRPLTRYVPHTHTHAPARQNKTRAPLAPLHSRACSG